MQCYCNTAFLLLLNFVNLLSGLVGRLVSLQDEGKFQLVRFSLIVLFCDCSVIHVFLQLQSFLQISIFQIGVDECIWSDCAGASGCNSDVTVRDTPTVVDSGTMSLVSVTVESTAVCYCPGREQVHQPCSVYPKNPCFNGGICVDSQHGYRYDSTFFLFTILL